MPQLGGYPDSLKRAFLHALPHSGARAKSVQFAAGITVRFAPDSLSSFNRNRCPVCAGIGDRFAPEYAPAMKIPPIVLKQGEFEGNRGVLF
jgi:hypothetical protein